MTAAPDRRDVIGVAVAVATVTAVVVVDALTWHGLFDEGSPRVDPVAAFRSVVLLVAVGVLVRATTRRGTLSTPWSPRGRGIVLTMLLLHLTTLVLMVADPDRLHLLGQEDGAVENVTALAFVLGGLLVGSTATRWGDARRWTVVAYAGVMVLGGLEEISYGQRLLGFSGPELITRHNLQNEVTLHNIATDPTETVFYGVMTAVLVLLPLAVRHPGWQDRLGWLAPLAPRVWVAVAAAPVAALVHEMWDVVPVQLTVWSGLVAALVVARDRSDVDRGLALAAAVLTLATVAASLLVVDLVELHDASEFKELLLGLLVVVQGLAMRGAGGTDVRPE